MHSVTILRNASVVDVDAVRVREADVVVRDGVIAEVSDRVTWPHDASVIDVRGGFLLPGLIDAHVHVTSAVGDSAFVSRLSPYYTAACAARTLRRMLRRGFTTVRDVGGADWGLARAVAEGLFVGPRIHYGGPAFSQTGGHGDMRTLGDPSPLGVVGQPRISAVVDGAEQLRVAAREELRKGAHHIKVFLSGGVAASPTDQFDAPQYSDAEIKAVVDEAQAARRYVAAHAYTSDDVLRGMALGVRSFEHGNLLDARGAAALASADVFLVPTLATYDAMAREGGAHGVPENPRWPFTKVLEWARQALAEADRTGVVVVYGTDLLGTMQDFQSDEFALRAEVQTSPRVLAGATTTAARLLGIENTHGRVAPGFVADLVVADANPLEDVRVLADPIKNLSLVMRAGSIHHTSLDVRSS